MVGKETASLEHVNSSPLSGPEVVADFMEKWLIEADVKGFNGQIEFPQSQEKKRLFIHGMVVSNPGGFEDIVELLILELQKRGLY